LNKVLVLGLGNDILSDDAVGLRVARAAAKRLAGNPAVEAKATTEMGLALLDEIAGREGVVVVDAIRTGLAPPGTILEVDPGGLSTAVATAPHFLGLGETLAFGRLLGLEMPRAARVIAIEVADPFTVGTRLTPAVGRAVPAAAERAAEAALAILDLGPAGMGPKGAPRASASLVERAVLAEGRRDRRPAPEVV
jgi:hydrogenase maturation protease